MALGVGMVGLTHPHSAMHLRTLTLLCEVEQVALYDPLADAHPIARQHCPKVGESYTELDALLERADLPVVIVALPTDQTPGAVARAAAAGKHVLCEKPVARNAAELAPVVRALAEHRRAFGVFYTWRRHPAVGELRELAQGGALGRLTSVELRMVTTQPRLRDPSHWLFRRDIAGGGITSWLACHWLDAVRFITGDEVAAVSALTGTLSGEAIDVEDVSAVSFRLTGGALGTLHAGYLIAEGPAGYEGTTMDAQLIVRGSLGRAEYIASPGGEQVVVLHSMAPGWHASERQTFAFKLRPSPAYGGAYGEEFVREFLAAALGNGESPATIVDALRVVEILDAVYESAESGRRIEVARGAV